MAIPLIFLSTTLLAALDPLRVTVDVIQKLPHADLVGRADLIEVTIQATGLAVLCATGLNVSIAIKWTEKHNRELRA